MPCPSLFQGAHLRREPSRGPFVWPHGHFFKGASPPLCAAPPPMRKSPLGLLWCMHFLQEALGDSSVLRRSVTCTPTTRTPVRLSRCPRPVTSLRSQGAITDTQHCGVHPGQGSSGRGGCTPSPLCASPWRGRPAHMVMPSDTQPHLTLQCLPPTWATSPPPPGPGLTAPGRPQQPALYNTWGPSNSY